MFRFSGGHVVSKGTYWNLSTGTGIRIEQEGVLPGNGRTRYLKVPAAGMFFLVGPLSGLLFLCLVPALIAFTALAFLPRIASASDVFKSEEAAMCLGCHGDKGAVASFKNKEKISIFIDEKHFRGTVHGFVTCTGCHSDVSMDNHPSVPYGSKREFALQISRSCRTCHSDEELMATAVHRNAAIRPNAPPCSECHGSHAIRKVLGWKEKLSTTQYCLTCHRQNLSTSVNGQPLSLSIDERILKQSVHSSHQCSDCHASFTMREHPVQTFSSRRELSLSLTGACRRCHPEKHAQFEGSIHYTLLKKGNAKAPLCTDCHGAHDVGPKALAQTVSGVPCRKCHENAFDNYADSVHGRAKIAGKDAAPLCSSCHVAHEVKPALASRSPGAACFGCHANAASVHAAWLPNAALHLDSVACTACHVPAGARSVYLRVVDRTSGKNLSRDRLKESLGADYEILTQSPQEPVDSRELWTLYRKLNAEDKTVSFAGTLGLQDYKHSHGLAPKGQALHQCETCHTAGAAAFNTVSLIVLSPEGREERYPVNEAALGSVYALLPLNQFYALGSTRLKALDIVGILMILGGILVPAVHSTMRIMVAVARGRKGSTIRNREDRR